MRISKLVLPLLVTLSACSQQESMENLTERVFRVAQQQYTAMDTRLDNQTLPQTIAVDSSFKTSTIYWWCSGFYPGSLWYIYEYTQDPSITVSYTHLTLPTKA